MYCVMTRSSPSGPPIACWSMRPKTGLGLSTRTVYARSRWWKNTGASWGRGQTQKASPRGKARNPFDLEGPISASAGCAGAGPGRPVVHTIRKGGALSTYDTTTSAPGQQSSGASGAQEKAQEATQVAQEKAQEAKGVARDRVRTEVDTRSTQAGEQVSTAAQDTRSVAEHLRSQGKD